MTSVLILNGPNLNLLGDRQIEIYGRTSLAEIERMCLDFVSDWNWEISFIQSNHEGILIDSLHDARLEHDGVILNAGGYTHTSIALMDAIASIQIPVVEVHLSDIYSRESFRQLSYLSKVAIAQVCGMGAKGYLKALEILASKLTS
ncbi:MAG: type II 3-dehydroquinate dehydratase [Aestuariivita sp.]|nr:type II 3-dehydroquinate dehydratase [Aestuariivita sp.]